MNLFDHYGIIVRAILNTRTGSHKAREDLLNEVIEMIAYQKREVGRAFPSDVGSALDTCMMLLRSCYAPHDTYIQTHSDVKRRLRLALVVIHSLAEQHRYLDKDVPEYHDVERVTNGMVAARDMDNIPF